MSVATKPETNLKESFVSMSPNGLSIRLRIPSEKEYLNNAILTLRGICEHVSITNGKSNRIILALEEALLNAFEHAYVNEGGVVDVEFAVDDSELSILVEDYGCGIPDGSNNLLSNEDEILCDRGRGLNIINKIPDKISIDSASGRGTRAKMLFYLASCV